MRILTIILCLGLTTLTSHAETFPQWDVSRMCADADAIVIADQGDGDRATIVKWIRGPMGAPLGIIEIADLAKHSKKLNAYWSQSTKRSTVSLTTHRFVAFLAHKDGLWRSMATIDDSGLCGSCGMVWIQDGHCYRYTQAMNPGPYDLDDARDIQLEKDLLAAIDVGLADAKAWTAALRIKSPAARALTLGAYAMASTSPENPRTTYRFRTREPLRALGSVAVPALRRQIAAWHPGDSLDEVVLTLYDLGQEAQDAVPDLITLLSQPERAHPCYVLSALRTTANATVVPQILPFLKHSKEQVRHEANKAIEALKTAVTPPLPAR